MRQDHPSILRHKQAGQPHRPTVLSSREAREVAFAFGADDAGLVSLSRPELDGDREHVLAAMPSAKSVLCIVKKMASPPIQSPARSLANHEFHSSTDEVGEVGRLIARELTARGIGALNTSAGFPMEMQQFPGRTWVVSHKLVAEAAGLGKMGIHRNIIHPKFGNFILLNSILIDCEVEDESQPIDYNPCVECKLCVSVCPVGAIGSDGHFDAVACLNHNYREFMGGFIDWVDTLANSRSKGDYQDKVTDQETASVWQSLSTGPNYKSAYCMAVCPAGDDIIGRFLDRKSQFIEEVVKPLQKKVEPVYVVSGSDAEEHAAKRFPHKELRRIGSGVRPRSVRQLLDAMPIAFQRGRAKGMRVSYDFLFTGDEKLEAHVRIAEGKLEVQPQRTGQADLAVEVDSRSWIKFLAGRVGLPSLLLTRRLKFRGDLRLLAQFGKCFPS
jgi:epoxyqueuosine reductase QueG